MTRNYRQFHCEGSFVPGQEVTLPENLQHRLRHVLRLDAGATIHLFSGQEEQGVYAATIADSKCRRARIEQLARPAQILPPLTLFLGIPKREAFETILRQATELGVTHIHPLLTKATVPTRLNMERAQALLIEAAEQSERTTLPKLHAPQLLEPALTTWFQQNPTAHLYWANESGGQHLSPFSKSTHPALLIGPEGGFMPEEQEWLNNVANVTPITLGNTILRTDTAAIAGLVLAKSTLK